MLVTKINIKHRASSSVQFLNSWFCAPSLSFHDITKTVQVRAKDKTFNTKETIFIKR